MSLPEDTASCEEVAAVSAEPVCLEAMIAALQRRDAEQQVLIAALQARIAEFGAPARIEQQQ